MEITVDYGLKESLKPELILLNQSLEKLAKETNGFLGDLLSYVMLGSGKRIRPALVLLGSRLGLSKTEDVRLVETAVELIHIATLIHDDVIDKAALRRGRKTVTNEFGIDTAVLLGDHIYTYAFHQLARLNHPQILQLFAEASSIICRGEIEQLKRRFQFNLSVEEYFAFLKDKTASLFGASVRAGAILAGQGLGVQKALEKYAENLGIAFQITDDIMDLTGEEAVVGKTLRTDLLNGKMTLPLIYFRENMTSPSDLQLLDDVLYNPDGHLTDLIAQVKKSGSLEYAEEVVARHIDLAKSHLDDVPACRARDHLASLAEMLLKRKT